MPSAVPAKPTSAVSADAPELEEDGLCLQDGYGDDTMDEDEVPELGFYLQLFLKQEEKEESGEEQKEQSGEEHKEESGEEQKEETGEEQKEETVKEEQKDETVKQEKKRPKIEAFLVVKEEESEPELVSARRTAPRSRRPTRSRERRSSRRQRRRSRSRRRSRRRS